MEMIKKNNILITSAGQRVSLVQIFAKELSEIGGKVYAVDTHPMLSPACQVAYDFARVSKVTEEALYIQELLQLATLWDIKLILPTIDTELELLARHSKLFLKSDIVIIISSLDFVKTCRNKSITNDFFVAHHTLIPKIFDKKAHPFPVFIKPIDGSLSKDLYLFESDDAVIPAKLYGDRFIWMEYIAPSEYDEFTVDTYYDKNGVLQCVVPRQRLFVRAGEVNKAVTRRNVLLHHLAQHFGIIEGARGCLTFQFFLSKVHDRILGIEINPRFGGGYPLSYFAGANFPKWLINEYILGISVSYFDEWQENLLLLRYDAEVLVANYESE